MTSQTFVLLSGALTFGVPMALAVRELLTLPTFKPGGHEPPPEEPFIPAPKPLPDCLLPTAWPAHMPISIRMLEDA